MARGLRAGDPKIQIATCAVMTGKPDQWSKPMSAVAGSEDLYDVLNVHTYPFKEKWPTWRRSYPEDSKIRFVADVRDLIAWRDEHAAGKQVWVTEFGYDAATKPPPKTGDFAKWVGNTDDEQARYSVRAFLVLAAAGVDRAYLYFFNDKDEPKLHAASGITRNFEPKPAFHAVAHLYRTLGDYRLSRVVSQPEGGVYCYEFAHATKPDDRVYVAWLATDADVPAKHLIPLGDAAAKRITVAERMPTAAGDAPKVTWKPAPGGVEADVGGAPVYFRAP
jgi:serine/threonine-protein kinase ATR